MAKYFIEQIVDSNDGDEAYSYALIRVENGYARTVCVGIQSRIEAVKLSEALPWFETFLDGSLSIPKRRVIKEPIPKKRKRKYD